MNSRIVLKLPSQMAFLGIPDAVLLEIGSDLDCPRQVLEELGTAVIEACTNAMEHGNHLQAEQPVEIHIEMHDASLEVVVLDEGSGFDVSSWKPAEDIMRERGRGILIMREFTDRLEFDRAEDGRFRVRLVKNLDGAS